MRRKSINVGSNAGFTLVEVLLVVAILGILAAVVAVSYGGKTQGAMIKATRASIKAIETAVDMYEVDNGKYPSSLQNLVSSSGEPNWRGPYIRGGIPKDSWGIDFSYASKGEGAFEIRSGGPDTQMNTGDDILNSASVSAK